MYKNSSKIINKSHLDIIFNHRLGRFKRVYYFSNFKQKIYETPHLVSIVSSQNKIITEELLRQYFLDDYQFEDIDLHSSIRYFEKETDSKIILNSRGLLACKKIKQIKNIQYILAYSLNSFNQIKQFNYNPDVNIRELNLIYENFLKIQLDHKSFNILLNIDSKSFGQMYFNSNTSKRLIKISDIVNMPNILTKNEFKLIQNLQITNKKAPRSIITFDDLSEIRKKEKSFNLNNIFTVHATKFLIRLTGISSSRYNSMGKLGQFKNNYVCLNYIKNIGKLDNVIEKLEYHKLKNL
jgi:hypothetical protein